jgi:Mn-dependent DtxR family transcriptional regulator
MHLSTLRSQNLVEADSLKLTKNGQKEARRLVRAHRLWETYLVNKVGLTAEQIHEDAEKYEHLLTDEILDEVDATLGYPTQDPHGSPIPKKDEFSRFSIGKFRNFTKGKNYGSTNQ